MRKLFATFILLLILHINTTGQNLPNIASPASRPQLLLDLKKAKTDSERLKILIKLGSIIYYKGSKATGDDDKEMSYATQARAISHTLNDLSNYNLSLLLMADVFSAKNDQHSFDTLLLKAKDTTKINIYINLSRKYRNLSDNHKINVDKALVYALKARELSIANHLKAKEMNSLYEIAAIHFQLSKRDLAEREALEVLKGFQSIGYPYMHYTYNLLSWINVYKGDLDKALSYSLLAVKSMEASRDTSNAGDFYFSLAEIYKNVGNAQKSIEYYKKSFDIYATKSGPLIDLMQTTVDGMLKTGMSKEALDFVIKNLKKFPQEGDHDRMLAEWMLGDCYKALKQYNLAEKHYLAMFKLEKKQQLVETRIYGAIGQFYVERRQYKMAEPYLRKLDTTRSVGMTLAFRERLYFFLFKVDSAAGRDHSAMRYLIKNKKTDDSIYNLTKTADIQKLQIQYETEKKESAIKIKDQNIRILNSNVKLQQARLDKSFFVRNMTIGGILLMLIVAGLLYWQYRAKKQANLTITDKNELLESLLQEKEWLLKEVHHRVKNNLQMVISLLESQSVYPGDDASDAMESSRRRIFSMSLIHQKLYQSDEVKVVDMSAYLPEFVSYLRESLKTGVYIYFDLEIEPIQLSASQAVPLALVLNEAITNSMKHAFPGKDNGRITIKMKQKGETVELIIKDNGIGMAKSASETRSGTLGLNLMKGLIKEIRGQINFETNNGTTITILFKVDHWLKSMRLN